MIVCLVTDRRRLGSDRHCLLEQIKYAVDGGVDLIQLREHDLEAGALVDLAVDVLRETRGSKTRLVVNDRLDVALASGADGVHLRQSSFDARAARRIAPPGFLVGCSVHSVREAARAAEADYLVAGTIFESRSKPDRSQYLGIDGLRNLAHSTDIPVLGIGGVTLGRVAAVASTGAQGIAAIGLFMSDVEPNSTSLSTARGMCRAFPLDQLVNDVRRQFAGPQRV